MYVMDNQPHEKYMLTTSFGLLSHVIAMHGLTKRKTKIFKGILPQTNFYRPNLIFWIVMNPRSDLKATRTDLKTGRDRTSRQPAQTSRQAPMIGNELYYTPRKQRRILLHKLLLLCFLGCGKARFLSFWPASRSVQVASGSDRGLPQGLMCGSPRGPR